MNEEQYKRYSVAYHEAGHAIAARGLGVGVGSINLWLDGGGEVRHETTDDETRAAIAIAGWVVERIAREAWVEQHRGDIAAGRVPLPTWAPTMHESDGDREAVDTYLRRYAGASDLMRTRLAGQVEESLRADWDDVRLLATELLRRTRGGKSGAAMSTAELDALLDGKPLPQPAPELSPAEARARLATLADKAARWWPGGDVPSEFTKHLNGLRARSEGRAAPEPELIRRTYAGASVWVM